MKREKVGRGKGRKDLCIESAGVSVVLLERSKEERLEGRGQKLTIGGFEVVGLTV